MKLRDRIKSLRRVRAKDLRPNPKNWRVHNAAQQDALRGVLAEVGIADALLARELPDGSLMLIDGHLRADVDPDVKWPVLILDVTEAEADLLLATVDPLAAMAEADPAKVAELLAGVESTSDAVQALLDELGAEHGEDGAGDGEADAGVVPERLKGAMLADLAPTEEETAILSGREVLVEFSGGLDSSAAAVWCRRYLPDAPLTLAFVDMGADFVGFQLFLHQFADWLGGELAVLRSTKNMVEVLLAKGKWPHFRHPYCHEVLHDTLDEFVEARPAADVVVVRGGRLAEKAAGGKASPDRWLVIDRLKDHRYFQPLYFADKDSSGKILDEAGAPRWEGYGRGLCRTACRICPGQRPVAYAAIRREYPEVWAELLALEAKFGSGCWQGRVGDHILSFTEQADKADAKQESS